METPKKPAPQPLNQAALLALLLAGNPLLLGEVRAVKTDSFNYTVKTGAKAGAVATLKKLVLTVEAADAKSITVETFLPDDVDLTTYQPTHQKGDKVVVIVSGLQAMKGEVKCNGMVHPFIATERVKGTSSPSP